MSVTPQFPYQTNLDIKFGPREKIDLPSEVAQVTHPWFNQTLCLVNDSVVRYAVVAGQYHWHKHDTEDEFFFVLSGKFIIEMRDRTVELGPQQGYVVPKGVEHRPSAPEKTVLLMVEPATIVPTGS
jgi:mannose-6-phosphate isomerase-like protein (cupin superfamily)